MENTGFGKRLKELRQDRDMTMEMLVADINSKHGTNMNRSLVSRWESGLSEPSLSYSRVICEYFNVSLDYMIGLTENKTPARLLAYSKKLKEISNDDKKKK